MTRCIYQECGDDAGGRFYLAPGTGDEHPWPLSIPYLSEPLPLCGWHGLLLGDERVAPVR